MMPEEKQWETVHGQMILFTCEFEEMYLINAEANARANHLPRQSSIEALLEQRDQPRLQKWTI